MSMDLAFHVAHKKWVPLLKKERAFFEDILHATLDAHVLPKHVVVSLVFTDDTTIQALNAQYRHMDKPTNVLSFPQIDDFTAVKNSALPTDLGDVMLAYETIIAEAKTQGKTLRDHTAHLLVHGVLHILGYDHMTPRQAKQMESEEIAILAAFELANPYL